MKKIIIVSIILVMFLLINSACSIKNNNKSEQSNSIEASFEIYLVKNLTTADALKKDLDELELEKQPLLTDKNISEYIWDKHQINLIKDDELNKILNEKVYGKVPVSGKPFVVVCNGEKIYSGAFWTMLSSLFYPECPTIISDYTDRDFFEISLDSEKDVRDDKRIYEALKKLGKIK